MQAVLISSFDDQLTIESMAHSMGQVDGEQEYKRIAYSLDPSALTIDNYAKVEKLSQTFDDPAIIAAYNRGYCLGAQFGALGYK